MGISFRPFKPTDLDNFAKCNMDPLTETYDLSFYLQYYARWPTLFQVAVDQKGNILGYIMGKIESSPEYMKQSPHYLPWHAHITALTVAPEARRLGIGQILTKQLEDGSESANPWFVDLFVRKSNEKAIKLYEKMGYSVYRVVKDYYGDNPNDPSARGEDAYDMRKPMPRDKTLKHIRKDGRNHAVQPEDVF
ncbi:N-acetyltransferase 5 [Xylariaceae sp. FL0255]|nr:N-acetyltransferase 5 [Xylariaceae sp. FL0255]